MSWLCSVCVKSFSRKDSMQRHVMSKHSNAGLTPFQRVPMSSQKCQRFRFEHPFTSMIAGTTGVGKTAWIRSLLQQASEAIYLPPERIVWCYSQWQPAYTELLVFMAHIGFVKGILTALEQDSYFDVNKRNLIVFCRLFTTPFIYRNHRVCWPTFIILQTYFSYFWRFQQTKTK